MKEVVIHVASQGKDYWSGNYPEETSQGADGPCCHLHLGLYRARRMRRLGFANGPIVIRIQAGEYFLHEPLRLGSIDHDIRFVAAEPGTVRIHSAVRLSGWTERKLNGVSCWVSELPAALQDRTPIRSLFVNGERRSRPISIRDGWHQFESVPHLDPKAPLTSVGHFQGSNEMTVPEGVLEGEESEILAAEILVSHFWVSERMPIAAYDRKSRKLRTTVQSLIALQNDLTGTFARFRVENLKRDFKNPGDWYLDQRERSVYYAPHPGESMNESVVEIPLLSQLFLIEGEAGAPVRGITFEGIEFYGTESIAPQDCMLWSEPYAFKREARFRDSSRVFIESHNNLYQTGKRYGVTPQAAHELPGVLHFRFAESCGIYGSTFHGLGLYGVVLEEGCWRCEVKGNTFHDLGAGAIQMDGADLSRGREFQNGLHTIHENHIYDTGMIYPAGVGILSMFSCRNRITANHIHHTSYSGISCGWVWGRDENISWGHLIERNRIHHLGVRGGLSDLGGIYLLGIQPGTLVKENVIHDVAASTYGGAGIYLDEGSSLVVVEGNLIYGKCHAGLHFNKVRENRIRYNVVLVNCADAGFAMGGTLFDEAAMKFPGETLLFERNLLIVPQEKPIYAENQWRLRQNLLDADLNWYGVWKGTLSILCHEHLDPFRKWEPSETQTKTLDFSAWQASGRDLHGGLIVEHQIEIKENKISGLKSLLEKYHFPMFDWRKRCLS